MKNWICFNLFGEHPADVDAIGMISGIGILSFLTFCFCYLFIYIPFFCFG